MSLALVLSAIGDVGYSLWSKDKKEKDDYAAANPWSVMSDSEKEALVSKAQASYKAHSCKDRKYFWNVIKGTTQDTFEEWLSVNPWAKARIENDELECKKRNPIVDYFKPDSSNDKKKDNSSIDSDPNSEKWYNLGYNIFGVFVKLPIFISIFVIGGVAAFLHYKRKKRF